MPLQSVLGTRVVPADDDPRCLTTSMTYPCITPKSFSPSRMNIASSMTLYSLNRIIDHEAHRVCLTVAVFSRAGDIARLGEILLPSHSAHAMVE